MTDVFTYFDYRKLVTDILADTSGLSLRGLARQLSIDPSFLSKILRGERNLSMEHALAIAGVLGLGKDATRYFEHLVRFNQARSLEAKRHYFEKLLKLRKAPEAAPLTSEQYRFYSEWYHTVIRELLHFHPLREEYDRLAGMLVPPISPSKAKKSVELLESLGILHRRPDGTVGLTSTFVTAGPEVQVLAVRNFQTAMMDLAKEALGRFDKEQREISTMTLSLSEEGFEEARGAIRALSEKLREIARDDCGVNCVYQMNFQAFPVTRVYKEADDA